MMFATFVNKKSTLEVYLLMAYMSKWLLVIAEGRRHWIQSFVQRRRN